MREELTEIVCIIDRSGSMAKVRDEAISGFNSFLEDQAAVPVEAALTLVRFDTEYEVMHNGTPIAQVPLLDETSFVPRGMTALYDAIGRTIDDVGGRLSKTPETERPAHVIVAILTDGHENSSSDYTSERVRGLIEHQQAAYDWDFVYLGANQNAFAESRKLGLAKESTRQWDSTSEGTMYALREMSTTVSAMRQPATPPDQPTRRRSSQRKSKTDSSQEAKSE
jgi:uncharacterized protein YegL